MFPTGTWRQQAGASGTVTVTKMAVVLQIYVHSTTGGTVSIFGGTPIPIIAGTGVVLRFPHCLLVSRDDGVVGGSQDIVFAGTDSYFVESVGPGNT